MKNCFKKDKNILKSLVITNEDIIKNNFAGGALRTLGLESEKSTYLILSKEHNTLKDITIDGRRFLIFPPTHQPDSKFIEFLKTFNLYIFHHSYSYFFFSDVLKFDFSNKIIFYNSHNVDSDYFKEPAKKYLQQMYKHLFLGDVYTNEEKLFKKASQVYCCTNRDKNLYNNLFSNSDSKKIKVIENGASLNRFFEFKNKQLNTKSCLFSGSWGYPPNMESIEFIKKLSRKLPDWQFNIYGIGCPKKIEKNIVYHGTLSEKDVSRLLNISTIGLNFCFSGGGSNIKNAFIKLHGLYLITSKFGSRGDVKGNFISDNINEVAKKIKSFNFDEYNLNQNKIIKSVQDYTWPILKIKYEKLKNEFILS